MVTSELQLYSDTRWRPWPGPGSEREVGAVSMSVQAKCHGETEQQQTPAQCSVSKLPQRTQTPSPLPWPVSAGSDTESEDSDQSQSRDQQQHAVVQRVRPELNLAHAPYIDVPATRALSSTQRKTLPGETARDLSVTRTTRKPQRSDKLEHSEQRARIYRWI